MGTVYSAVDLHVFVRGGLESRLPTREQFSQEIQKQFHEAELRGVPSITLSAGMIHRVLGGYPGLGHQMPSCCDAMYAECDATRDHVVERPKNGRGASLTIRYALPRGH